MGGMEAAKDADDDRGSNGRRTTFAARRSDAEESCKRFAVHVLENEKHLRRVDDVERRHDVRMLLDARGDASFVDEASRELGVFAEVGVEALDRNRAREADAAAEAAEVNARHAAGRDLRTDDVASDHG